MKAGVCVWSGVEVDWVGLVYLFQWLLSDVEEVLVLALALLMVVMDVLAVFEEEEPSFFPLRPLAWDY